ncbi:S41 family peptidase [soil metagenome]
MSILNRKILLLIIIPLSIFLNGCKEHDEEVLPVEPASELYEKINDIMKEWYLWNDQLPSLNLSDYKTPQSLMRDLRFKDIDRWSYVEDEKTFDEYYKSGQYHGYGFGMKIDPDNNLRVSFVYKDSPMDRVQVTRGYKILKINGKSVADLLATNSLGSAWGEDKEGVASTVEVEDLAGQVRQVVVKKEAVKINSVLHSEVKSLNGKKIGYLVFNNFIDKSVEELNEAFTLFNSENISELILDLRYNGGGSLHVAQHLANLIAASKGGSSKFVELTYNEQKKGSNEPYTFKMESLSLSLDRMVVITTKGTASASEAIINGLRPFLEVVTVGDYTSGKPVGMNVWRVGGYALVPITFKVANSLGAADYFGGIAPDGATIDDLTALMGDVEEKCLKESLFYLENGVFSSSITRRGELPQPDQQIELTGFKAEVGAF